MSESSLVRPAGAGIMTPHGPQAGGKIRAAPETFKRDAAVNAEDLDARRAQLAKWHRALAQ